MTKEELIAEAKRRYPIGCVIDQVPAYGCGNKLKITTHENPSLIHGSFSIGGIGVYEPLTKKWAEIVSYPKNYIVNNNELIFQSL